MASDNELDKRLESFRKTFARDLDRTVRQRDEELNQRLVQEFHSHMDQAEECAKKRDFLGAERHTLYAEMIRDFLRGWK
jgi:hypothetical protein